MDSNNNIKSVPVFSGTQWEAGMIKNLLENEQIESYVKDGIMASLNTFPLIWSSLLLLDSVFQKKA